MKKTVLSIALIIGFLASGCATNAIVVGKLPTPSYDPPLNKIGVISNVGSSWLCIKGLTNQDIILTPHSMARVAFRTFNRHGGIVNAYNDAVLTTKSDGSTKVELKDFLTQQTFSLDINGQTTVYKEIVCGGYKEFNSFRHSRSDGRFPRAHRWGAIEFSF